MKRGTIDRLVCALLMAVWIGLVPPQAQAQAQTPSAAKAASCGRVAQALPGTGLTFTKHNDEVWSIDLKRKNLDTVKVILSCNADLLVVFVTLAKRAGIQKTPQLLDAIAIANQDYDLVKIGFDSDGDLAVRIDLHTRVVDATEVKVAIDQVANACNEWYPKVAAYVKR